MRNEHSLLQGVCGHYNYSSEEHHCSSSEIYVPSVLALHGQASTTDGIGRGTFVYLPMQHSRSPSLSRREAHELKKGELQEALAVMQSSFAGCLFSHPVPCISAHAPLAPLHQ